MLIAFIEVVCRKNLIALRDGHVFYQNARAWRSHIRFFQCLLCVYVFILGLLKISLLDEPNCVGLKPN